MSKTPLVSVVMSVYNSEATLKVAIESILNQTFIDFEFIVINDGSTDKTAKILASLNDPRIKVYSQTNHGLIYSLNLGIEKSKGEFIARMDDDDVSDLQRLEKQVTFLQDNPRIDALGCAFAMTDDKDKILQVFARPTRHIDITRQLYVQNPLGHGSMMIRKQALTSVGNYDQEKKHIEDYDLWIRLYQSGATFAVLPEVLYHWRSNPLGVSSQNTGFQRQSLEVLRTNLWANSAPPAVTIREMLAGLRWYKSQLGEYTEQITREYASDQHQLATQYLKHHHVFLAFKQWIAFILMQPYSLYIVVGSIRAWTIGSLKHLKHLLKTKRKVSS